VPDGQLPLLERPQLIALNKVDVPEAHELADLVRPELEARGFPVYEVSAVSRAGLRELSFALGGVVAADREAREAEPEKPRIVIRPRAVDERDFTITVEGGSAGPVYTVHGAKPERWVAQTDFENEEAVGYLADGLAKLGVEEELFAAGAVPGAAVVIGPIEFDWEPTLTSAAELVLGNRGTDARFDESDRRTNRDRRASYHERMDAKAAARAELEAEREAGLWTEE
jgi:GTPase